MLKEIYGTSLALLTDLYQITMAYGYWKSGRADEQVVFHMFFRKNPFRGGYAVAAGLQTFLELIRDFRFTADDIDYLRTIEGNDAKRLFDEAFLSYLGRLEWDIDIDVIPEGTVVFAHEPLVRVMGSILQAQLLETALLNIVNFQTLIATKAARVARAAHGLPVLEFGLRRAQGIDGSLAASRAAYIGGCSATSNVLAGKLFRIPVRGTHAHSWVMSFASEQEAFQAYAHALPNNCVFLVDTYDTLEGVRNAIEAGLMLRKLGHEMVGIRLDSGDLGYLSAQSRKMLDEAGLEQAVIVASNDLDEYSVESLRGQGARISVWGVGTKLVTAYDQPALGGVYKLGAIQTSDGRWIPRVKLSEQLIKTSTPGILQVRRFHSNGQPIADMIYSELQPCSGSAILVDPFDPARRRQFAASHEYEDLLVPAVRSGELVAAPQSLTAIRQRACDQMQTFHESILRLENPHEYSVGLESQLYDLKSQLVSQSRQQNS